MTTVKASLPGALAPDIKEAIDRALPYATFAGSECEVAYNGLVFCGDCGECTGDPVLLPHPHFRGEKRHIWYYRCPNVKNSYQSNCNGAKEIAPLLEERIDDAVAASLLRQGHYRDGLYRAALETWNEAEELLWEERSLLENRQFALTRKLARFNTSHVASSLAKVYRAQLSVVMDRLKEIPSERQPLTRETFEAVCDRLIVLIHARQLSTQWRRLLLRPLIKKVTQKKDNCVIEFNTRP